MKTNRTNEKERLQSGKRAGIVGFLCNLALSAVKIGIGMVSGALSVTADGLNNLSDAAASVITFLGFHVSSKPADREHPYGHARFEYLAGLTVSALMLAIAFEVGKSALDKILHPEQVSLSPLLFGLLVISVPIKAALAPVTAPAMPCARREPNSSTARPSAARQIRFALVAIRLWWLNSSSR